VQISVDYPLIGGTTGGGKSTALHSLLMSIVYKQKPGDVHLLILDFGSSELDVFAEVPHLDVPIVTDMQMGLELLKQLKMVMERRINLYVTNRTAFDDEAPIVCIIDEFPAFIGNITSGKGNRRNYEVVQDILQLGRKNKIHMILAAQDPTKESIKISTANITARMAFRCAAKHNSRVILEHSGAESLTGLGSMYFVSRQHVGLKYLQGSYMHEKDIKKTLRELVYGAYTEVEPIVKHLGVSESDFDIDIEASGTSNDPEDMTDDQLLAEIIMLAFRQGELSNNQIQNEFSMGYNRAKRFETKIETLGIIPRRKGQSKRHRKTIPTCLEQITNQNVIKLLTDNNYTLQDISNAIREGLSNQQGQ